MRPYMPVLPSRRPPIPRDRWFESGSLQRRVGRTSVSYGNLMRRFDVLAQQAAAELDVSDAILEGEIIVTDETVRP
jgi:hypothetical protein